MRRRFEILRRARSLAPLSILLAFGCAGGEGDGETPPYLTYPVTVSWDAPRTNADGTPLKDLGGYRVYAGRSPRVYDVLKDVRGSLTATLELPGGLHHFAVTAYDTSGNEGDFSEEVSAVLPLPTGSGAAVRSRP
jgi:hypothetical protein